MFKMENETCKECKRVLVLDEESLCAYCELTQEKMEENTLNVNCGICKYIVKEDSEGLICDVCNSWFHNNCNDAPLDYELYVLLNEAPKNVKWFCDKCIWETEKWIKDMNCKHHQTSGEVGNTKKIMNKVKKESTGEERNKEESDEDSEWINEDENDEVAKRSEVHTEDNENDNLSRAEINLKIGNKKYEKEDLEDEDSDDWIPTEKIKQKKKQKTKQIKTVACDNVRISENTVTENTLNKLDISPEKKSSITDGIRSLKSQQSKHIRSKCNLCPKSFKYLEDCIAHKLRDHEGVKKPHKCPVCGKTFVLKRHRERHMEKHSTEKKCSCNICGKTLKHYDSLRIHLKLLHSDEKPKLYKCTECDYTLKSNAGLEQHMISKHSGETQFQCKICSKYCISDSRLKHHMAIHSSDKPFACEVCDKNFKSKGEQKKHMLRHSAEKPFECKECDKKFATNRHLAEHTPSHIPYEERPHACDQCESRFNSISALKYHKQGHTGMMKAICDICGKGCRSETDLKRHTMMHSDERPLKCEICGKGFKYKGQLDLHIKYHKKIVTARCPICNYGAPTRSVLNSHIRNVHTNETPYECDICGSKYKTKGNLSKHKRGIRGSCKGFNSSVSSVEEKRESSTSHVLYHKQNESKYDNSAIPLQDTSITTARMSTMQNHGIHPSLLFYANSQTNNGFVSQYHGNLLPPNSKGITATIPTSHINY